MAGWKTHEGFNKDPDMGDSSEQTVHSDFPADIQFAPDLISTGKLGRWVRAQFWLNNDHAN